MNTTTADAAAIQLMTSQQRIARVSQLREVGLSDDQIARKVTKGIFVRISRGLVSLGPPSDDFLTRATRYVLTAGEHAVAALWTAAELHGIDTPRDHRMHALVVGNRTRDSSSDLYVHRTRYLPTKHVTTIKEIPATSLARTLVDCASQLDRWSALRAVDSCNASTSTWRMIHLTAEELSNGRAGVRVIVDATSPDGADRFRSVLERLARDALRAHSVPEGERNYRVFDAHGFIREVDIAYPAARVAVEYDGLRMHRERHAEQRDRATDRRMVAARWRVLRFTWEDVVHRPITMTQEIMGALGA
jgi:hypothetical protein